MNKWKMGLIVVLCFAIVLSITACGTESEEKPNNTNKRQVEASQPVESASSENAEEVEAYSVQFLDAIGQKHEFTEPPKSVATLNPGIMDILIKLGANVTGRPTIHAEMDSTVEQIQDIGNPHEPSFEQIVSLNPEVLIVPPSFQRFAETVTATGVKVIYENMESIKGIQDTITRYGELFANEEKAKELNYAINEAQAQSVESTQKSLIVYGAPGTYLAALDNSLYVDILKAAGGYNIASDLPVLDKYPTFASLSAEKIVEGNPQLIMLITHSDPEVVKAGFEQQMNENPAWKNLDAVKNGNIIILPSELFDNPGTQVIEALNYMRELLKSAETSN